MRRLTTIQCLVLAPLVLVLAACGDSTGPASGLDVAVTMAQFDGPGFSSDSAGNPLLTCVLHVKATTSGTGAATWIGGKFRFYIGKDHTTPVDTAVLSASEVSDGWGSATIAAGATQTADWNVWAGIPFSGELEFQYRSEHSGVKTSKVPFVCGPSISQDTPPPTITSLTLTPPSGELPAGAPVNVSVIVNAPAGLWQTVIHLSGPYDVEKRINERLQTSQTYNLVIPIPGNSALGVPIKVDVGVIDGAAQVTSKTLSSSLVLADHQRPTIQPMFFPPNGGSAQLTASGDYFGGDSIQVLANAGDNHALAAVVWEVLPYGVRDSVIVSQDVPWSVFVKMHDDWSGPIRLKLWARDAVGLVSDTVTTPVDSLRVHPMISRPTRTVTVSGETRDIVIDSKRGNVYLRQGNDHRIAVLSMATMQVTSTLALDAVPMDFDLTAGGDSLLLVIYGHPSLGVVDLRQPTLTLTEAPIAGLDAAAGQMPSHVRAGSNGKAYVTLGGTTTASRTLLEVDLATASQRVRADAGVAGTISGSPLERSLDHSVLMLTLGDPNCLQRFDLATNAFSSCALPAVRDWAPTVDGSGQRAAVGLDVYDAALQLLPKAHGPMVFGIPITALSSDGGVLMVSLWNYGIVRLRASDSEILDRTPNTVKPTLVRLSPDGTMLVSIESHTGPTTIISVIDLR